MRFAKKRGQIGIAGIAATILLVGCAPGAAPTTSVQPTNAPASAPSTASAPTAGPTQNATAAPLSPGATPLQTLTATDTASPPSTDDDLAALFATMAPALAALNSSAPVLVTGEEAIAQLQSSLDDVSAMFPDHPSIQLYQDEIDRYSENGLVERGSLSVGTAPQVGVIVYRFESESGAAADFGLRESDCEEVTVPGAEIADVVAKNCNVEDSHNDVHLIAHRGDLVFNLRVSELPEDEPIEPALAALVDVFRTLDALVTR